MSGNNRMNYGQDFINSKWPSTPFSIVRKCLSGCGVIDNLICMRCWCPLRYDGSLPEVKITFILANMTTKCGSIDNTYDSFSNNASKKKDLCALPNNICALFALLRFEVLVEFASIHCTQCNDQTHNLQYYFIEWIPRYYQKDANSYYLIGNGVGKFCSCWSNDLVAKNVGILALSCRWCQLVWQGHQ